MKKTLLIITALFAITFASFAQAPKSSAYVEIGVAPFVQAPRYSSSTVMYTDIGFNINVFKYGFVEGRVQTLFDAIIGDTDGVFDFMGFPFIDGYKVGFGAVFGPLTIGFVHECTHPVAPNGWFLVKGDAAYERVYARYDIKF